MIRRSHPWFTPQTLQIRIVVSSSYIVNTHRMSSKHGSNPLSLRRTELCEPCILLRFRKTQRTRRRAAEVGTGNGPERRTARGVRRRLDTDAAYRTRTPYSNSSRVISDCVPGITLTNARDILEPRTALSQHPRVNRVSPPMKLLSSGDSCPSCSLAPPTATLGMPGLPPSPRVRCRKVFVTYSLTALLRLAASLLTIRPPLKCVWGRQALHQVVELDAMLELMPS